jgi:hypothetical protein
MNKNQIIGLALFATAITDVILAFALDLPAGAQIALFSSAGITIPLGAFFYVRGISK